MSKQYQKLAETFSFQSLKNLTSNGVENMVSKIEMNNGAGKRDRRFLLLPN
jgi:hypothetical protein